MLTPSLNVPPAASSFASLAPAPARPRFGIKEEDTLVRCAHNPSEDFTGFWQDFARLSYQAFASGEDPEAGLAGLRTLLSEDLKRLPEADRSRALRAAAIHLEQRWRENASYTYTPVLRPQEAVEADIRAAAQQAVSEALETQQFTPLGKFLDDYDRNAMVVRGPVESAFPNVLKYHAELGDELREGFIHSLVTDITKIVARMPSAKIAFEPPKLTLETVDSRIHDAIVPWIQDNDTGPLLQLMNDLVTDYVGLGLQGFRQNLPGYGPDGQGHAGRLWPAIHQALQTALATPDAPAQAVENQNEHQPPEHPPAQRKWYFQALDWLRGLGRYFPL